MPPAAEPVAVVIRVRNEAEWLGTCLQAVTLQDYPSLEIIVVDNGSTDRTRAIAARYGCRIVDYGTDAFNYSRALNIGITATDAPLIAILSGHCIPTNEQWLMRFVENLRDPETVAVYGRQEPLPDSTPYDKRDLWTTFGPERREQRRDYYFNNANSMIRRSAWAELPFNENIHGLEDQDWARKILRGGRKVVYEPRASVFHHHGIHHGQSEERVHRQVRIIELIRQDLT